MDDCWALNCPPAPRPDEPRRAMCDSPPHVVLLVCDDMRHALGQRRIVASARSTVVRPELATNASGSLEGGAGARHYGSGSLTCNVSYGWTPPRTSDRVPREKSLSRSLGRGRRLTPTWTVKNHGTIIESRISSLPRTARRLLRHSRRPSCSPPMPLGYPIDSGWCPSHNTKSTDTRTLGTESG